MSSDVAILQLMQTPGLGVKTLGRLLTRLAAEERPVEDLLSAPPDELVRNYALKKEIATAFQGQGDEASRLSDTLRSHEISVVSISMPEYPAKLKRVLKESAPPVLFVSGNQRILTRDAVAISGSRHASDASLNIARSTARALAEKGGLNIVGGYAQGVDLAAHHGALEACGVTTFVLAEGILHFGVKQELEGLLTAANHVIVSEFPPRLGWIARNAMQRNRTICGLSEVVIVIEANTSGGTFAAGQTALELARPFFVVDYPARVPPAAGNQYFLQHGARALPVGENGQVLNLQDVFEAIEAQSRLDPTDDVRAQLSLNLS